MLAPKPYIALEWCVVRAVSEFFVKETSMYNLNSWHVRSIIHFRFAVWNACYSSRLREYLADT